MTASTASQTGEPTPALSVANTRLVIPLYSEATVAREVISQTRTVLPHVAVIGDGSKDALAREAAAAGTVVVRHLINLGQGVTPQTGFSYVLEKTNVDYVVISDTDGQHLTTDAVVMVAATRAEDLAVALGSCLLEGPSPMEWLKRIVLRTTAAVSSYTSGMRLADVHNGLRVLRRDVSAQFDLRQNRMAHVSEIIHQTGATDMLWREFPVRIVYTGYSRVKSQSLWSSVNILIDLLFS